MGGGKRDSPGVVHARSRVLFDQEGHRHLGRLSFDFLTEMAGRLLSVVSCEKLGKLLT